MELVELLNKLIDKGWKPRWLKHKIFSVQRTPDNMIYFDWWFWLERCYDFRRLTSKESWLWQFVCKNHLYIYKMWENKNFIQDHYLDEYNECCCKYLYDKSCYEYYLLECALYDEKDLEKFLIDNINL